MTRRYRGESNIVFDMDPPDRHITPLSKQKKNADFAAKIEREGFPESHRSPYYGIGTGPRVRKQVDTTAGRSQLGGGTRCEVVGFDGEFEGVARGTDMRWEHVNDDFLGEHRPVMSAYKPKYRPIEGYALPADQQYANYRSMTPPAGRIRTDALKGQHQSCVVFAAPGDGFYHDYLHSEGPPTNSLHHQSPATANQAMGRAMRADVAAPFSHVTPKSDFYGWEGPNFRSLPNNEVEGNGEEHYAPPSYQITTNRRGEEEGVREATHRHLTTYQLQVGAGFSPRTGVPGGLPSQVGVSTTGVIAMGPTAAAAAGVQTMRGSSPMRSPQHATAASATPRRATTPHRNAGTGVAAALGFGSPSTISRGDHQQQQQQQQGRGVGRSATPNARSPFHPYSADGGGRGGGNTPSMTETLSFHNAYPPQAHGDGDDSRAGALHYSPRPTASGGESLRRDGSATPRRATTPNSRYQQQRRATTPNGIPSTATNTSNNVSAIHAAGSPSYRTPNKLGGHLAGLGGGASMYQSTMQQHLEDDEAEGGGGEGEGDAGVLSPVAVAQQRYVEEYHRLKAAQEQRQQELNASIYRYRSAANAALANTEEGAGEENADYYSPSEEVAGRQQQHQHQSVRTRSPPRNASTAPFRSSRKIVQNAPTSNSYRVLHTSLQEVPKPFKPSLRTNIGPTPELEKDPSTLPKERPSDIFNYRYTGR